MLLAGCLASNQATCVLRETTFVKLQVPGCTLNCCILCHDILICLNMQGCITRSAKRSVAAAGGCIHCTFVLGLPLKLHSLASKQQ